MITYYVYPYGSNHLVVFGATQPSATDVRVGLLKVKGYQLEFTRALSLSANGTNFNYTYSIYGWYSTPYLQLDFETKRITFPVSSSEGQPYTSGYVQLYVDPQQNCISTLPVPSNCGTLTDGVAPVHGSLVKHFDNSTSYIYSTGLSEEIVRSSTIETPSGKVLVTLSPCQLQARVLKDPSQAPNIMPHSSNNEVSASDLC